MTEEIKKALKTDYPLIPMNKITDEARLIAVAWVEGYERQGMDIPGKQKLASDIMNYARRTSTKELEEKEKEIDLLNRREVAWSQKKEQLESLLDITESQRNEWADMCIKKQARIEELEGLLKGHGFIRTDL